MIGNKTNRKVLGLNPLNQTTYKYFALSTIENSPYAKPPATAAVQAILEGQEAIMSNIRFMAQKVGLLGLITASITPPSKKPNETDAEYQARCKNYLQAYTAALDGNLGKGLLVAFRDAKFEHTNVSEGASGVYELNRMSEEQVFSGMGAMPGFHGRTDSTTETFADVVYYLLTAQVGNMQRLVKRRCEQTDRLDLRLGGIEVDGLSMTFNKAHSRNALAEAQTDQTKSAVVFEKVKGGLISPDAGAQELGYETWFDVELLFADQGLTPIKTSNSKLSRKILTLSFNKYSQKYEYQPDCYEVLSIDAPEEEHQSNVVPIDLKKKAQQA